MTEEEEENVFFSCVSVSFFRVIPPPPEDFHISDTETLSLSLSLCLPRLLAGQIE